MGKVIIIGLCIWLMATAAHGQEPLDTAAPPATMQRVTGSASGPNDIAPIPNPTQLTTEAIDRLKEQLTTQINLQIANLQKEIDRLLKVQDKIPEDIRLEMLNLTKLVDEKFKGLVDQQIQRDNNLALALTAAQKSVTDTNLSNSVAAEKAERNFKDQIAAVQANITDVKDRITRIESSSSGAGGAVNWVIVAIGAFATMLGIGSAIYAIVKPGPVPVPLPVVQYNEQPRRRT